MSGPYRAADRALSAATIGMDKVDMAVIRILFVATPYERRGASPSTTTWTGAAAGMSGMGRRASPCAPGVRRDAWPATCGRPSWRTRSSASGPAACGGPGSGGRGRREVMAHCVGTLRFLDVTVSKGRLGPASFNPFLDDAFVLLRDRSVPVPSSRVAVGEGRRTWAFVP